MPAPVAELTFKLRSFASVVSDVIADAACPAGVDTLMLNLGLRCDLSCAHCHHACSPERPETMSRDTILAALRLAEELKPTLVDVTGGEPALHPHIRELVELAHAAGLPLRVRTNLVALARPDAGDLPALFARTGTRLLASVPVRPASVHGDPRTGNVWETSLRVLQHLAALGYGTDALSLDLAHNPAIGELPEAQIALEAEFRAALTVHGVRFNRMLSIANVPVGRLRARLRASGEDAAYDERLRQAFNATVVPELECRHGIEIAWDETLWDCDFNLAAGLPPATGPRTLAELIADPSALSKRRIGFGQHCFACTAGAGSG